jgi:integrase
MASRCGIVCRTASCLRSYPLEDRKLRWADVDWLNRTLRVERGIVHQKVDDVKTPESQRTLDVAPELLDVLKAWKQQSKFSGAVDWVFASPVKIGRLPISYAGVWQALRKAGERAGIGHLSSHAFRHSYRTWLDAMGTLVGIQQRLMRHSDVRTTMNQYGCSGDECGTPESCRLGA